MRFLVGLLLLLLQIVSAAESEACQGGETENDGVCVTDPGAAAAVVDDDNEHGTVDRECPYFEVKYESIEHYLNPDIIQNPEKLEAIAASLQGGELVVLRNAFIPEYAEAMHCDLDTATAWTHESNYASDGFHFSHHNIYNRADFSKLMNASYDMLEHPDTKAFMQKLSGRDCSGDSAGSGGTPSYYMPGDHSLPHTDQIYQRTVAYVWHLSKNWKPEWGGALYWAPEHAHQAFTHASFNTLSLFSVHSNTPHFVSTVSPHATEKRLAFNGWWTSSWYPSVDDDLEAKLSTPEQRWDLTGTQIDMLRDLVVENGEDHFDEDRLEGLMDIMSEMNDELWPPPEYSLEAEY